MQIHFNRLKRSQGGFTLAELGFVLFAAAVLSFLALKAYQLVRQRSDITDEANNNIQIVTKSQALYQNDPNFTGATQTVFRTNGVFDASTIVGTTVQNKSGGTTTCAPAGANNIYIECTATNYDAKYCTDVLPKIERVIKYAKVNGTDVKVLDTPIDKAALGNACAATGNTFLFAFAKN